MIISAGESMLNFGVVLYSNTARLGSPPSLITSCKIVYIVPMALSTIPFDFGYLGNKKKRFQSGAEKRKKQKEKEKTAEKQRKFLAAFVVQSTSNTEESSTPLHEDKSTLHPDTEAETVNVEVRNEDKFQVENITSKNDGCNIEHLDTSDNSKVIENVNVSDNFPNDIALWPPFYIWCCKRSLFIK
ncbi:hypothetical protein AVEN_239095-1 [Araneus ventricosus]|uniref:Uncharacterized protein n=1 Tax=Araneus ventricosus TaxID=182803 RepID=A0A4Y2UZB8_ARAVE|nr:hypothetical protein AVEN_239095-1 [Araneus ventricosus]